MAGEQLGQHGALRLARVLLGQVGHLRVATKRDRPCLGRLDPGDALEQRRLAHPVRANQADLLARLDRPAKTLKNCAPAVDARNAAEVRDDHDAGSVAALQRAARASCQTKRAVGCHTGPRR